jgi:hypothetical protein
MTRNSWLPGSAAVVALVAMAANAHAGLIGGTARELALAAMTGSNIETVANRVCWRDNGVRRCRSINNVYGYQSPRRGNGYRDQIDTDPDDFPVGSTDWWRAMDYQDRGGQGNGHP